MQPPDSNRISIRVQLDANVFDKMAARRMDSGRIYNEFISVPGSILDAHYKKLNQICRSDEWRNQGCLIRSGLDAFLNSALNSAPNSMGSN